MTQHVMDDSLWKDELRLENEARSEGIARYRNLVEQAVGRGDGPQLKAVERLLVHWFEPLRHLIAAEKKAISEGRPGLNRRAYGPVLLKFNTARMALTTMHEVMSMLLMDPGGTTPLKLCLAIARGLNAEANYRAMRKLYNCQKREFREAYKDVEDKPRFKHEIWDALTKTDRRRITPKNTNKVAARFMPDARWSLSLQTKIGAALLDMFCRVATVNDYDKPFEDAIYRSKRWRGKHPQWFWRISDACRKKIGDGHNFRQMLSPKYLPMVVPPLIWTATDVGGYAKLPTHIIKKPMRHGNRAEENEIVREAVNAINATPWRVNRFMLEVVTELANSGGNYAGIPRLTQLDFPPRPENWSKDSPDRLWWKKKAAWIIRRNNEIASIARTFAIKLDVATRLSGYERIFFPHQLDFRGRQYPIPVLFNHQGDDVCRGLLEVPDSAARDCRGERAQWWLKVHLANCCGVDKVVFDDRIKWVDDNMATFAEWVDRPIENTGWMEQDDPFQALAAARGLLDPEAGSHLPVGIDGSNNALQHYSAMIRCEDAARMVNVLPSETPQDFYAFVADRVSTAIARDCNNPDNLIARQLDGLVTRKIVKQTAMTDTYGVTQVGARRQTYESLKKAGFLETELYPASKYLSRVVLKATANACPTVKAALEWLRTCARIITDDNRLVTWFSPIGLEVEQPYLNTSMIRIRTPFHRLNPRVTKANAPVKKSKHINAFAPSFVHSVDGAHIMCTAIACRDKGLWFAGVHDQDLGLAADLDQVRDLNARQFVQIHETPLLDDLHDQLATRYSLSFPPPPTLGSLDISVALTAPYMFA